MTENVSPKVIAVDLDGTLVKSDMLVESVFLFLRTYPLRFFKLLAWLLGGKAAFKRRLADAVLPDATSLPYNEALMRWLRLQREEGAMLVLATASDHRIADKIAAHLGIFDAVMGTDGRNLASDYKRDALVQRFGAGGFEYVGNSKADLVVWRQARLAHVAYPEIGVMRRVKTLPHLGEIFDDRKPYARSMAKALRLHQWAKNLLIFVPLIAGHHLADLRLLGQCAVAFLCFCACASSVYLLNDMLDLQDDRQHRTKRNRPLAAGTFPMFHAMLWTPALLFIAFGAALVWLPFKFSLVLLGYYVLTLAYSLVLKRAVMIDVVVLAMLYTTRVVAGTAAMSLKPTFWILAFCMFIFLSLALVKRYTELYEAREKGVQEKAPGRGYVASDFELLASLGGSAGYLSVLVLALYINDPQSHLLYRHPHWLWAACPLLLFWLSRVWIIAHRGEMHDDPIVFALRDRMSRWVCVCFIAIFGISAL